jgi:hypothetical protein
MTYTIQQISGKDIPTRGLPQSLQARGSKNAVSKSLAQCSFIPPHDQPSVVFLKYLGFEAFCEVSTFSHSPSGVFLNIPAIWDVTRCLLVINYRSWNDCSAFIFRLETFRQRHYAPPTYSSVFSCLNGVKIPEDLNPLSGFTEIALFIF